MKTYENECMCLTLDQSTVSVYFPKGCWSLNSAIVSWVKVTSTVPTESFQPHLNNFVSSSKYVISISLQPTGKREIMPNLCFLSFLLLFLLFHMIYCTLWCFLSIEDQEEILINKSFQSQTWVCEEVGLLPNSKTIFQSRTSSKWKRIAVSKFITCSVHDAWI